jgi:hypothetical protein
MDLIGVSIYCTISTAGSWGVMCDSSGI